MERIVIYLLIVLKSINSKQKNEINAAPLCLGNVSKDFLAGNINKNGLYGHYYYFSVDYDCIDIAHILDIRKYLMFENNIK